MSRAITVRLAFGIVIFSFLCSLFIASIFSALDPSALSGSPLGFFSYFALFIAQIFLVVPIVIFLRRNQMSLLKNFRLNVITKRTVLLSMLLSFGTVMISSEINIIIDKTLERFQDVYAAAGHPNSIFKINFSKLKDLTKGRIEDITE